MGIATAGMPNMFMVMGPNGPFTNIIPAIEVQVEFITKLISHAVHSGQALEVSSEAEDDWMATCRTISDMTLFPKIDSWISGANISGKEHSVLFYLRGLANYLGVMADVERAGFAPFIQQQASPKGAPGTITHTAVVEIG